MTSSARRRGLPPTLLALLALVACGGGEAGEETPAPDAAGEETVQDAGEVNVYSHRHYESDEELFDRFTAETGIEVNVVTGSADELITRLEQEGEDSPADLLVTVDAGRLHRAQEMGLLQPVESSTLEERVPSNLRDPQGHWYGLTQRARVIVYAEDRVDPSELSTYEALADDRWDDRLLIRSSSNIYNQSLLASIIAAHGMDEATEWAEAVADNLARSPSGGDTDQIKAVVAGAGDVAVVNTYYLGRLLASDDPEDQRVAEAVDVFFPNQGEGERGTHVNVSGAGVTTHAPNRDNAVRLLEFLTSPEAQRAFAQGNHEYPVVPAVEPSSTLQAWGDFRADTLNLGRLGELNDEAVRAFDEAGWP